jgi:hypothetical protein
MTRTWRSRDTQYALRSLHRERTLPDPSRMSRLRAILTDPQLWVPLGVLAGGLAVLIWVHG